MSDNPIVVFGDEMGLELIRKALPELFPSAVVYSCKRPQARIVAMSWAKKIGAITLEQPLNKDVDKISLFFDTISSLNPVMGLCFSYDLILPLKLLNLFNKGVFNLHGSLLPHYRGANGINWVLINGETQTGVTLHKMVEQVDAGPIVVQEPISIDFSDTVITLRSKCLKKAENLLKTSWCLLEQDPVPCYKQDESQVSIWPRRKPEDGLFDWKQPARQIYNLIRALVDPYPGAYYFDQNGNKIVINYFLHLKQVEEMQKETIGYVIK